VLPEVTLLETTISAPASFPCKINTFRKRVKNVVTGKGIGVGVECKEVK
jgi:hypothetical protein